MMLKNPLARSASLPAAPPGTAGWPWDTEVEHVPHSDDPSKWPRISIVTPSFNQGEFIEATLRSVLLQGYPNLQYVVMDGGSSDGTVEILEKYDAFLDHWVSEPDGGQAEAINQGLARCEGDVLAYINSDDLYAPGALREVGRRFAADPAVEIFHGVCRFIAEDGELLRPHLGRISNLAEILDLWTVWWGGRQFIQPEVFWGRQVWERAGPFDEALDIVFDLDFWIRAFRAGFAAQSTEQEFALFRLQPNQKTADRDAVARQALEVVGGYLWSSDLPLGRLDRWRLQGKWLYDMEFLRSESRPARSATRTGRWLSTAVRSLRHPKVWYSPKFRQRLGRALGLG